MKTFSVNENNDLFVGTNGNISISLELQAIIFVCENVAKGQLGEMVLDIDRGIPNFEAVWVGSPNLERFTAALRNSLNNVDGVQRVINLLVSVNSRILSYTATIVTFFGEDLLDGSVTI